MRLKPALPTQVLEALGVEQCLVELAALKVAHVQQRREDVPLVAEVGDGGPGVMVRRWRA